MTVSDLLEKQGKLEQSGGSAYLAELMSYAPSGVSIVSCSRIIKEKSLLRSVIRQSENFIKQAKAQEFEDIEVFLDQMEADVF